jgi:hypothetical protein
MKRWWGRATWLVMGAWLVTTVPAADSAAAPGAASAASAPVPTPASAPVMMAAGSLELDGDSTLHKYSAKTHDFQALFGLDHSRAAAGAGGALPPDVDALIRGRHLETFQLIIPVGTLRSGDSGLDRNMFKALKNDRFKEIRFRMDSYQIRPSSTAGATFAIAMRGGLKVAGVERPIDLLASAFHEADGVRIAGSADLLMTDYQIKPPVIMLGAIKTANLITVKFDVKLRAATR